MCYFCSCSRHCRQAYCVIIWCAFFVVYYLKIGYFDGRKLSMCVAARYSSAQNNLIVFVTVVHTHHTMTWSSADYICRQWTIIAYSIGWVYEWKRKNIHKKIDENISIFSSPSTHKTFSKWEHQRAVHSLIKTKCRPTKRCHKWRFEISKFYERRCDRNLVQVVTPAFALLSRSHFLHSFPRTNLLAKFGTVANIGAVGQCRSIENWKALHFASICVNKRRSNNGLAIFMFNKFKRRERERKIIMWIQCVANTYAGATYHHIRRKNYHAVGGNRNFTFASWTEWLKQNKDKKPTDNGGTEERKRGAKQNKKKRTFLLSMCAHMILSSTLI